MFAACEKMKPYAGLLLRLGLGVIFTYHGSLKVFGAESAWGIKIHEPHNQNSNPA